MARAAQQDWGFTEITRKFEREPLRRPSAAPRRKWLPLPSTGTAHVGAWLCMVALCLIGLVALHVVILQKNIQYNDLIREKTDLTAENAKLSSEVSELNSPERIEQIATGPLGMVPPEKMQYVYIGPADANQSYAELSPP
jgi:cell division protein FtsL